MQWRKLVYAGILCLGFPGLASASTAVLVKARGHRLWFEKVGKAENLLDNPARLLGVKQYVCDTFAETAYADSQPRDGGFEKSVWDEQWNLAAQVLAPVVPGWTVNLGYGYGQVLQGDKSVSRSDQSYVSDDDKTFRRAWNLGAATDWLGFVTAGYAGSWETRAQVLDYASDYATPYTVSNGFTTQRHTLGLVEGPVDVFGGFTRSRWTGAYDQAQELDFSFDTAELHGRWLEGELDQANWVAQVEGSYTQIHQALFALARAQYPLDYSNYDVSGTWYGYYPLERAEFGVGVECTLSDRSFFNLDDYLWQGYQTLQAAIPLGMRLEVVPGLHAWVEVDLAWNQSSRDTSWTFTCQPAWGLQWAWTWLELTLYTFPDLAWQKNTPTGSAQKGEVGLEACARF